MGRASSVESGKRKAAGHGWISKGLVRGEGCSQSIKGTARKGYNQCSKGSLSAAQSHSLDGPQPGQFESSVNIAGGKEMAQLCHYCWGEGNDPTVVDCFFLVCTRVG